MQVSNAESSLRRPRILPKIELLRSDVRFQELISDLEQKFTALKIQRL